MHFWVKSLNDPQSKKLSLVLIFDDERVDIRGWLSNKLIPQFLSNLILELQKSLLLCFNFFLSSVHCKSVDKFLLEVILIMGNLVLTRFTSQKWLIHPVFVVESWHLNCLRSIVVAKELLMLVLSICLTFLNSVYAWRKSVTKTYTFHLM